MGITVNVKLPANLAAEERPLFEPFTEYRLDDLKVLRLEEVFISYSGLCIGEGGLIKESHHAYPDKQQQFLNDAVYYYKLASDDSNHLIELDDDNTYLLIHHPWASNYWHWMSEAILRLWTVRQELPNLVLILPEHFKQLEFIRGSLAPFNISKVYYIPFQKSLMVRNVCLPQIKPIADSYYRKDIHAIRNYYLAHARNKGKATHVGDKIYISRKKATKRRVINEDDAEAILKRYGFSCINNEDYNFLEQIELFSNARYLVSIHGAGLTNMMFMQNGSAILEMHKKKTNDNDWHSFAFWYLADALDFHYHHQICDPVDDLAHFFHADFIVDVKLLEENLKRMLA